MKREDGVPRFELKSEYAGGRAGDPHLIPVTEAPGDVQLDRRHLLGVGLSAASVAALLHDRAQAAAFPRAHQGGVTAACFMPGGKVLATAGRDGAIKIWQIFQNQSPVKLPALRVEVNALRLLGESMLAGVADKSVRRLSMPGGKLQNLEVATNYLNGLAVSEGGRWCANGSWDKNVRLWSYPPGDPPHVLTGHTNYVTAAVFVGDQMLASGSWDRTIRLWSVPSGEPLGVLEGHTGYVEHLATPASGRLLSAARDGTIHLWDVAQRRSLSAAHLQAGTIRSLAVMPDGKSLMAGCSDGVIRRLDLPDLRVASEYKGHAAPVCALACLADVMASGDESGTVILWRPADGAQRSYLFDAEVSEGAASFNQYDRVTGQTIVSTQPCGSPIPAGATCLCNCVPGAATRGSTGSTRCTCDPVCTCVPVRTPGVTRRRCTCVPVMVRC